MQPLTKHREVSSGGTIESTAFGVSDRPEDVLMLKSILREGIYSDKVLAVLREYSANAWDAHRMVGKVELPIKVQLPTVLEPTLIIEDYGPGLSHDEVFSTYTRYCNSSKRDSNSAVGMLGIGSKSGFAYTDSFMVISRHGGMKRTYAAFLDENENDSLNLLSEEDCGDDTGMTIQIAVRQEDIREFETKARALFQHFEPRPTLNIELSEKPAIAAKLTHGIIYDKEIANHYGNAKGEWYAVMGCIPYRIDFEQLKGADGQYLISENFKKTAGLMYFNIGDVQISASRETLKYGKTTKLALVEKFELVLDEYVTTVLDEIEKCATTNWDRRIKTQSLLRLGLGKEEVGDLAATNVKLDSETFTIDHYRGTKIPVREGVRLVRVNNDEAQQCFRGFSASEYDLMIRPSKRYDESVPNELREIGPYPWDEVNAELEKLIQDHKLDGIQVVDISTLKWTQPYVAPPKKRAYKPHESNPKHRVRTFRLTSTSGKDKLSDHWEIEKREATEDDVFVVINQFLALNYESQECDIYELRGQDEQIAKALGLKLPTIYGYKHTEKKPVDPKAVTGLHYLDWRKKWLEELPADKVAKLIEDHCWRKSQTQKLDRYGYTVGNSPTFSAAACERVKLGLGEGHSISVYLSKVLAGQTTPGNKETIKLLRSLKQIPDIVPEARERLDAIMSTYPLLEDGSVSALWSNRADEWHRYIKLVDNESKTVTVQEAVEVPEVAETPEVIDNTVPEEKVEG